jgi:four helix bundle protein
MGVQSHRDLVVWQKGMDLFVEVYKVTDLLPSKEKFGLISQMQRAAASVPANIAEGQGRLHRGDFVRFLSISRGSLMEVETYLEGTVRLGYLSNAQISVAWELCQDVARLLNGLLRALSKSPSGNRISEETADYELDY